MAVSQAAREANEEQYPRLRLQACVSSYHQERKIRQDYVRQN